MEREKRSYGVLAAFVAGCLAIGALGGLATSSGLQGWYPALRKPFLNPPDWVFAPVWSFLYILIAVAGWRLWSGKPRTSFRARALFAGQLALNAAWSPVFFGLRSLAGGLAVVLLLWFSIAALFRTLRREDRTTALLLAPYWAWVTFAAYLNLGIYWINR